MKTAVKIIVFACLLGIVLSCQKNKVTKAETNKENVHNEPSTPNEQDDRFKIVLRDYYDEEWGIIKLDNKVILSEKLKSTSTGTAYASYIDSSEGEHELYVNINGIERTYLFEYKKGHSICIDYDPASLTISFHYYTYIWKPVFEG